MSRHRSWDKASSPYDVLGVERSCDLRSLRQAYLAKIRECHPDNGGIEEQAKLVNAAYDYLKKYLKSDEQAGASVQPSQKSDARKDKVDDDWMREVDEMYRTSEKTSWRKRKAEPKASSPDSPPGATTGNSSAKKQNVSSSNYYVYDSAGSADSGDQRKSPRDNGLPDRVVNNVLNSVPLWVVIWLRCAYWTFSMWFDPPTGLGDSALVIQFLFRQLCLVSVTIMLVYTLRKKGCI